MTDREDRIRELAYFLWLEEGCPEDAAEPPLAGRRNPDRVRPSRGEAQRSPRRIPVGNGDGGVGLAPNRFLEAIVQDQWLLLLAHDS
jgi:hypothetical protein